MSGRSAKLLRRAAERATVGLPAVAYNKQIGLTRKVPDGLGSNGLPKFRLIQYLGTRTLAARCTRAVYQRMKAQLKEIRRVGRN